MPEPYERLTGLATETVTRVVVLEGDGTEAFPLTNVTYWYTQQGDLIARIDPRHEADDRLSTMAKALQDQDGHYADDFEQRT